MKNRCKNRCNNRCNRKTGCTNRKAEKPNRINGLSIGAIGAIALVQVSV